MSAVISAAAIDELRAALIGRTIAVCFGSGVDSTAMLVALFLAGIRPDVITFADTGGEKPETYTHVERINVVLAAWGWPLIQTVSKKTKASTGYTTLEGNCVENQTLPSLAFGMKSCSIKWKQGPQDQFLKGAISGPNARDPHPLWISTQARGERIVKLIGYDSGSADTRRAKNLKSTDGEFDYLYPLQILGWEREYCVAAITEYLGPALVPIKSACFFCPASKQWELYWLAANHPDLMERALHMERVALTGRHSRFDAIEFGDTWDAMVANHDRFPSSNTTVGLGRNFAWNQWARVNHVVDSDFRVMRDDASRARFARLGTPPRSDNARDSRTDSSLPATKAAA
jgi:hypothetical protein